jgi:hypothetical protein
MRRSHFPSLLVIAVLAAAGCESRPAQRAPAVADTGARDDRAQFNEPGATRFGWRGPGKGGGFSVSVGRDFGPAQAEEVLRRLVALDSSGAFKQFTCGDTVPHFRFDLTLHQQGAVQERIVTLGHVPYAEPWGPDRCLHEGFDYLVARTFAQVDTGPSVDYGYRNPGTGKTIAAAEPGKRHSRWYPTCHCDSVGKTNDWVKLGPEETSLGATAH